MWKRVWNHWGAIDHPHLLYFQDFRAKYWTRSEQYYAEFCLACGFVADPGDFDTEEHYIEYDIEAQKKNGDQNTDTKLKKRRRGGRRTGDQRAAKRQNTENDQKHQKDDRYKIDTAFAEWASMLECPTLGAPREEPAASQARGR